MVTIVQGDYPRIASKLSAHFKGDYFDFDFAYVSENEVFREINRFIWESKHMMTRFKNRYTGPVAVCLSGWNEESLNGYFDTFMYFMKDMFPESKICFYLESRISGRMLTGIKELFPNVRLIELQLKKSPKKPH